MQFQQKFARIISILLVPPSVSAISFGLLTAAYQHGTLVHQIMVWILAVLFSGGIQIGYVLRLRQKYHVTDYDVPVKEQRTKPYLISAALALAGTVVLWFMNACLPVIALMICHITATLFITGINLRWKLSAHTLGFFGPLPVLLPLFGAGVLWALPVGVLLGWARIRLQSHTIPQVVAGAIAGFFLTSVQLFIIYSYVLGTKPF